MWDEDYSTTDDKIGVVRVPLDKFQGFEPITVPIDKYSQSLILILILILILLSYC